MNLPDPAGSTSASAPQLTDMFETGLTAPIWLTWELTYACNLACAHCLSSSGRRDPRELSTAEAKAVIDELEAMQVFCINIGGDEPTVRPDFWELLDYATSHHVGVKFSTTGVRIAPEIARRLTANDHIDVQVSLDDATPEVNDAVRGVGSYDTALRAMRNLADTGMENVKLSVVCPRHDIPQMEEFKAIADKYGAQLRLTRLRPSGQGADVWDELHPAREQQRELYDWLLAHGDHVLTGDSFFHLSAYGKALPGLNLCGAGRVVCLIDPVGDVYACPFAIHDEFLAGNVRDTGGFARVWRESELFPGAARAADGRRLRLIRLLRHVQGRLHGGQVLQRAAAERPGPRMRAGQRRKAAGAARRPVRDPEAVRRPLAPRRAQPVEETEPVLVQLGRRADMDSPPVSACKENRSPDCGSPDLSGRAAARRICGAAATFNRI